MSMTTVPPIRIRHVNSKALRPAGDFVLYWMVAQRRVQWNFALDHAVAQALAWHKPLVILEALRMDYPWASERLHRFVLQGMADNAAALQGKPVLYYPYVEPAPGAGRGLLAQLATQACAVVSDDFPSFFLPRMQEAAGAQLPVALQLVDSNGLLPMAAASKVPSRAFDFRRFLQHYLTETQPSPLATLPDAAPFATDGQALHLPTLKALPAAVTQRWPAATPQLLAATPEALAALPLDRTVGAAAAVGGQAAATAQLRRFLRTCLLRYGSERNDPDADVSSGLSPWLHFGHLSAHQVYGELADWHSWSPAQLGPQRGGQRDGFWQMGPEADAFLEELVTWRELGYRSARWDPHYHCYTGLPAWAQQSLQAHAADPRPHLYSLAALEHADTADPIWNAAQRQLVHSGRMHNYLRMLWGKRILEWSESPQIAFTQMVHLNNKYALDGRNPNSYSGIAWVLGRYDRAWGPERPIFGKVRYMSSAQAQRKLRLRQYLQRWGSAT